MRRKVKCKDTLKKNLSRHFIVVSTFIPRESNRWTCLGIDNSGYLTIGPDVEIEEGSFNTSNSNLWTKVMNYFANELKEEWALMRQGKFTLDNLMKYVIENQIEVIPPKYYNDDAQVKYLNFGSLYTYCCHGSKELLVKRWLRERIAYVDSMMGYFTSQDDQVTIRMNKTGYVEFTVTPYIPLYFSVKWSNAEGGTQTFKMKRGETKTFYYTSTTATDQEVIIYHAQYIKELGNLSNLRPSSCILANAYKLNNVEIHSEELYNINVTANKYLRSLDLSGCSTLGTVTATGSVLDVSNCKYLSYLNIDGTALTGVLLNTSGGSLKEIYYPKSIQQVQLIKQRLLEKVGLPYGNNGADIPTSLYTVDIQECPNIKILNTSQNSAINKTWISMKYCQNLTVRNSLDFEKITLDGFQRLKILKLENMFKLKSLGFDDMLVKGEASTLQYMGISYCPELTDITMNCTSNNYEITFADGALLNLSGASNLNSISSNCIIKGLETIVLPLTVKHLYFTNEYGTGYSSIKNIWSSRCCEINEEGVLPIAIRYEDKEFIGMDLQGMKLNDIDLGALVNIPKAINFDLAPTSINPNFNINRDGVEYPYLQPQGLLDLSNYTESLARFFNGVDLDKLEIIVNNPLPQTDLSYCFYNSTFSNEALLMPILNNVSNINNLDYCFYKTIISDISILNHINMGDNSSMNYTFAECENITNLKDITIPSSVVSVEGMFYKCPLTSIRNITVNVQGSIKGLFKGCSELTTIETFNTPNVTDVSSLFEGCGKLSVLTGFELSTSCTNIDNLFNGCNLLTRLSLNFGSSIVSADNWFPPNLETLNDTNIESGYVKMTNCSTLKNVSNLYINNGDYSDMFNGCPNLTTLTLTMGANITGLARFIKGCSKITSKPFTEISESCTTIEEIFNGTNITDITGMTFGSKINNATNWLPIGLITANNVTIKNNYVKFDGCNNLTLCNNLLITNHVTNINKLFNSCSNLREFTFHENCDLSRITTMEKVFYLCNSLSVLDFKNFDISSVTNMIDLFRGPNNVTFKNFRLTSNNCNYIRAFWYPYYYENIYIGNNNAVNVFGKVTTYKSNVKTITNLEFGSDVTDVSSMFEKCKNLTHDFIIPSTFTDCTNTFKDCTSITHIHSNWKNEYENEITSTDCYAGCTGITHIDDDNVVAYDGDNGLDYIPTVWGGNGFDEIMDYCGVYELEIPNDNYTLTLRGNLVSMCVNSANGAKARVNWGDGTVDIGVKDGDTHTYTTAGTYYLKGNVVNGKDGIPFKAIITKILRHPKIINNGHCSLWQGCSKLVYANFSNFNPSLGIKTLSNFISGCTSLSQNNAIGIYNLDTSQVTSFQNAFYKTIFTFINLSTWDTSKCTSFRSMFANSTSLLSVNLSGWDLSNISTCLDLFNGCTALENIDVSNWKNMTKKSYDVRNFLYNCTSLTSVNFTGWDTSTINNFEGMFRNCSSLISLNNIDHFDFSNATNVGHMFNGCSKLTAFDAPNWNPAKVTSFASMFNNCISLTSLDFSSWTMNAIRYGGMLSGCTRLTSVKFPSDIAQPTDVSGMFSGTSSLMRIENCPIIIRGTSGMAYMYWAYSDTNTNPIGQVITFATKGELGSWDIYYNKNFFKRVASETITNIANAAYDYTTEGTTFAYNTNGSLAYFTDAQVSIFTNKGWTLT